MRPVVMIDYGGILPQLQDQLSSLLQHLITEIEKSELAMQFVSIQKIFSTVFSSNGEAKLVDDADSSAPCFHSSSTECIDLSYCMENTDILVPTLNG
ncbi:hypothetical protein TSUD_110930 [Trifolium subterraneum]|uniref:Uncharacterized protein n=1 Tax=Trifolium subterraneum TaxID=3900 RepID=A0A2Z6LX77_TRISU|nr:hypothetical protein TSUD_110930 [Trifolium subterraneum]